MRAPTAPMPVGLLAAFLVTSLFVIICYHTGMTEIGFLVKGLPVMLLLVAVALRMREPGAARSLRWIWLGLAAGMVGDVAIELNFVWGLAAFLIGHIFYLVAMGLPRRGLPFQLLAAIPAALVWGVMMALLVWSEGAPPAYHLPVAVYMTVITLMMARAWGRGLVYPAGGPQVMMLLGASLFVFSDTCIAVNRWLGDVPFHEPVILGTYYLGQLAISRSR